MAELTESQTRKAMMVLSTTDMTVLLSSTRQNTLEITKGMTTKNSAVPNAGRSSVSPCMVIQVMTGIQTIAIARASRSDFLRSLNGLRLRVSGMPMISATVVMTFSMSTVSPRVSQTMNGIHASATTYTMIVERRACSRSPLRMRDSGPTEAANGAAAMNTSPTA